MDLHSIFLKFGLSIAIGVFIGLQREHASKDSTQEISTGIRTFALMGLVGCTAAMLSDRLGSPWPFVTLALLSGLLILGGSVIDAWRGETGLTTEFSALLTIALGALIYLGHIAPAIAASVAVAVLISFKLEIHAFVRNLTREDIIAALKFAVITAIVLPVLPNKKFGPEPFNVFNPHTIWLLVVLISAISFVGYVLIKITGSRRGIWLAGMLGGLVSSTAVTLTMTQRSKNAPQLASSLTRAVLISWTIMYGRVLVVMGVVQRPLLRFLWPAMVTCAIFGLLYSLFLHFSNKRHFGSEELTFVNPFELGPAIKFGLLFSLILLFSKAASIYMGDSGLYVAGILSGLADVDAISLSVAALAGSHTISMESAARVIILACAANTLLKTGVVIVGGSPEMRKSIIPGSVMMIVAALIFVLL